MDINALAEKFPGQDLGNLSECPPQAVSNKIGQSTVVASVLILAIINVVVIAGNILVIVAVFVSPKLRTVTNFFIVSLGVADLLVGIVVLPYSITLEALDVWIFGEVWCQVWLAVDVWMCTSSILNLCAISVDRYLAVTRPFKYRSIMSSRRAKLLIAAVWVLSFIICFPPLVGWNDKSTQIATYTPLGTSGVNYSVIQSGGISYRTERNSSAASPSQLVILADPDGQSAKQIRLNLESTPDSLNSDELFASFGNTNRVNHHPHSHNFTNGSLDSDGFVHPSSNTSSLCIVTKCALINNKGYVIYSALGSFYIPMFVMLFFYWRIYLVASGTTKALKRGYRTTKSQKAKSGGASTSTGPLPEERLTLRIHRGYPVSDFSASGGGSGSSSHTTSPNSHHHPRRATSQRVRNPPSSPCLCRNQRPRGGSVRSHESENCFDKTSRSGSVNLKKSSATSSSSQNTDSSDTPNASCSRKGSNGKKSSPLVTRLSKRTTKWQARRFHAETKAAKTVGIIVGGFICCWLPFFTVYLTRAFCEECIPDLLFSIFFWLGYCNSAINPFIYALFSRDFRNAFRNIICRCKFREDTGVSSLIRQIHLPTFFEEMPEDKGDSSQQDFN